MPQPPLEEFSDDPGIDGQVPLLRRVPIYWLKYQELDDSGLPTISGQAFQLQRPKVAEELGYPDLCISFCLESIVLEELGTVENFAARYEGLAVARIVAEEIRGCNFGLQLVPEPTLGEPWHVAAFPLGSKAQAKKAQGILANKAELVLLPQETAE